MDIQQFQARHSIHFEDPALLQQALTHRSYLNEQDDQDLRSTSERLCRGR